MMRIEATPPARLLAAGALALLVFAGEGAAAARGGGSEPEAPQAEGAGAPVAGAPVPAVAVPAPDLGAPAPAAGALARGAGAPAPAPAAPLFGEAVIRPIESNLAEKPWVSATASSRGGSAQFAIDQDPRTAWSADPADASPWLALDLGGTYANVRKVEIVFPDPSAVHRFVVEASSDGEAWDLVADASGNARPAGGYVALMTRPGTRFVRVRFTGTPGGAPPAVSELRAFNYLRDDMILGADLSNVDNFQDREYWVHPLAEDRGAGPHLLDVVKDRGMRFIRLRIWNEPRNERTGEPVPIPRQGPERSLVSARWVVERGMQLGIDFHYADSWADPGKQPKPRAWAELPFEELVQALHDFTADYLRQLVAQGTTPAKVAIGNEVINGFLWGSEAAHMGDVSNPPYFAEQAEIYRSQPGGGILWRYWRSEDPEEQRLYDEAWDRFATLVAAGIRAVREASPTSKVEIHTIVDAGRLDRTMEFWQQLLRRVNEKGADPDVLAISYYPNWHGTIADLERNLHAMATAFPQYEFAIAETSYPASGEDGAPMPNSTFPRTIQGQADAIQRVFQAANDVVNDRAVSVLTWEPASWQPMFRPVPGLENTWEPHASIDIYNRSHARHVVEDRVYVTTRVGEVVSLPATVRVLTTATGELSDAPVTWSVAPGAAAAPGELSIQGRTPYGEVTALVTILEE